MQHQSHTNKVDPEWFLGETSLLCPLLALMPPDWLTGGNGLSKRDADGSVLSSRGGEGQEEGATRETRKEEWGSRLRRQPGRRCHVWVLPLLSLPLFGLVWGELFKLWCGLTCSSCPPLLGPVRHLAAHCWQHYDGLGIVIQDACHLFTSQPSLISHRRPYNPPAPPHETPVSPPLPPCLPSDTLLRTTPYNTTALATIASLHPSAEHRQHI